MFHGGVRRTPELERVTQLPRRDLASPERDHLVPEMTALLRRPGSTGTSGVTTLRRSQALALYEIAEVGGGFLSLDVGEGKTLVSALSATVLGSTRTLLLLPAGLIEKTNRDFAALRADWLIPTSIRLFSYEMLGQKQSADEIAAFNPDLIVCDEVQALKNLAGAARVKRVARFMASAPYTPFVALSGTMMSRSILEFAHVMRWSLKEGTPLPFVDSELEEWARAIDDKVDEIDRYEPGVLLDLSPEVPSLDDALDDVACARRRFRRRLVETPGVVAVSSGENVPQSIYLTAIQYAVSDETLEYYRKLREEMLTPDDFELFEGSEVWRHALELALGFHSIWDPRPPPEWLLPRKKHGQFVRAVLARSETLDSPSQVEEAILAGRLPRDTYDAWKKVEHTFTPNPVPVWHDDGPLRACLKWMQKPGLVWTSHRFFAERLAKAAGTKYFGAQGLSEDGTFIDDAPGDRAIVVSADANREGRNLQKKWSRNLITCPEGNTAWWHQLLGRTHRTGQTADEVIADVLCGCLEHLNAMRAARASARAVQDTTGSKQKLLLADTTWPGESEVARMHGARWKATKAKPFVIPV